jgi:hypothetical protein
VGHGKTRKVRSAVCELRKEGVNSVVWCGVSRNGAKPRSRERRRPLNELPPLLHLPGGTAVAPILIAPHGVPFVTQCNHLAALGTFRGCVLRRIGQFLEVVFVRAVIHVHFGLDRIAALGPVLPIAGVFLGEMEATEGEAPMIAAATVAGEGKKSVRRSEPQNSAATSAESLNPEPRTLNPPF